ncbi:hypothetical protein CXB51_018966 [Gossypium anomalum]|uniref:RNase H type-1 domain-containing protein n=1 Tax=Gossypium anomalum TaxID=47600 RepID=A0A8J5YAZ9_9ROSI|nr:hypothetical protein CXB51_018966 [Gossypium anomalum]
MLTTSFVTALFQKRDWIERNKKLHERVSTSGRETVNSISCYIKELEIGEKGSETVIVAKNNQGKVLFSRTILHPEVGTAFAAKALACLWAIRTSSEMGFPEIIIEGDSLSIVKKCNANIHDRSVISGYIRNIKQEMNRFSFISIQHINRSENQLAHLLAKECLSSGEVSYLEDDVPSHARQTMENEWA